MVAIERDPHIDWERFGGGSRARRARGRAPKRDAFSVGKLTDALQASETLNDTQAAAVKALGTDILAGIFDAKRRNALAAYIPRADCALKNAVKALKAAASEHYVFALRQESDEMEAFQQRNFILAKPGLDAFKVLQYGSAWSDKRAEIDRRRDAATAYAASLDKLTNTQKADQIAADEANVSRIVGIAAGAVAIARAASTGDVAGVVKAVSGVTQIID